MWTIKMLLVVISSFVIGSLGEISGLQNNFNSGYSYDRPEAVPAELAYYQKIPGSNLRHGVDQNQHQLQHQHQHHHHHHQQQQQFNGGHSNYHQPSVNQFASQSFSPQHHHQFNEPPTNQYIPPEPVPDLPFVQENGGFRPINVQPSAHQLQDLPFIRENTGLRLVNSPPHQFSSHYQHHHTFGAPQQNIQVESGRSHQNEIPQNTLNFLQIPAQNHQNSASVLSGEKLQPPTSFNSQSASQVSPLATHQPNNKFMASVSSSYNAPLPFPFGTVPIKFDPLPLKTHLRQERLLPITSYEAKEFYKK